ncbi:MAG: TlpA family protein disulfide reductase [Pirellulaceae bacterium]|nr:TlpA family protein disulfide reductase [Pirellulaceae bacterium]
MNSSTDISQPPPTISTNGGLVSLGGADEQNTTGHASNNPWLFLIACAAFMLVGIMFLAWMGSGPAPHVIGKPLPTVHFQPLLYAQEALSSDSFDGTTTVLYLWAPWSQESHQGFANFVRLYHQIQQQPNTQVLSIAFPEDEMKVGELRDQTRRFLDSFSEHIPTYYDADGQSSIQLALVMPYGSLGFPTTLVVDPSGIIQRVAEGSDAEQMHELEQYVASLAIQPLSH